MENIKELLATIPFSIAAGDNSLRFSNIDTDFEVSFNNGRYKVENFLDNSVVDATTELEVVAHIALILKDDVLLTEYKLLLDRG
jgi:hypothetical protein